MFIYSIVALYSFIHLFIYKIKISLIELCNYYISKVNNYKAYLIKLKKEKAQKAMLIKARATRLHNIRVKKYMLWRRNIKVKFNNRMEKLSIWSQEIVKSSKKQLIQNINSTIKSIKVPFILLQHNIKLQKLKAERAEKQRAHELILKQKLHEKLQQKLEKQTDLELKRNRAKELYLLHKQQKVEELAFKNEKAKKLLQKREHELQVKREYSRVWYAANKLRLLIKPYVKNFRLKHRKQLAREHPFKEISLNTTNFEKLDKQITRLKETTFELYRPYQTKKVSARKPLAITTRTKYEEPNYISKLNDQIDERLKSVIPVNLNYKIKDYRTRKTKIISKKPLLNMTKIKIPTYLIRLNCQLKYRFNHLINRAKNYTLTKKKLIPQDSIRLGVKTSLSKRSARLKRLEKQFKTLSWTKLNHPKTFRLGEQKKYVSPINLIPKHSVAKPVHIPFFKKLTQKLNIQPTFKLKKKLTLNRPLIMKSFHKPNSKLDCALDRINLEIDKINLNIEPQKSFNLQKKRYPKVRILSIKKPQISKRLEKLEKKLNQKIKNISFKK